jgi:hypothetical protein
MMLPKTNLLEASKKVISKKKSQKSKEKALVDDAA